jgi:hypothetical protein
MMKRADRGLEPLCRACCAKPMKSITGPLGKCYPWAGEFDDDDNPMLNGELYLPGERVCRHRDCVSKDHIR